MSIQDLYKRFRKSGYNTAEQALHDAKAVHAFEQLGEECVRIRAEEEQESYFDVYGKPEGISLDEITDLLNRWGCWHVFSEFYNPVTQEWEHADGVGMCVYLNPCDPFENCYVPGLMKEAVKKYEACHDAMCAAV